MSEFKVVTSHHVFNYMIYVFIYEEGFLHQIEKMLFGINEANKPFLEQE